MDNLNDISQAVKPTAALHPQLDEQRRSVDFDTYDVQLQQLLNMLRKNTIDIAPVYQRQFRWDDVRCEVDPIV